MLTKFSQQPRQQFSVEPVFSLKARLARENIVNMPADNQGAINQPYLQQMSPFSPSPYYSPQGVFPPPAPYMAGNPYYSPSQFAYGIPMQMPQQNEDAFSPPPNRSFSQRALRNPSERGAREEDAYMFRNDNFNHDLAYPMGDKANDKEDKNKKRVLHVNLQNDLVSQMEEKKRKKAEEDARRKQEDELEDQRIRRENDIIRERDELELQKKKNKFNGVQLENQKLANSSFAVIEHKKGRNHREMTPVKEVRETFEQKLNAEQ